jgi:hypothetical protein
VLLPRPRSGTGRLTLVWDGPSGAMTSAFRIDVPLSGSLPIAGASIDPVDDLGAALSAPPGGVGSTSAALIDSTGTSSPGSEHCGNGELQEDLYYIGGYVGYVGEHCDDGNSEDGDGCSSDCRHELVYLGGAPADSRSLSVVYVPAGWGDLDAFVAYARFASEGTLAADFYAENADKISFWALAVEEVDELGSVACWDVGGVIDRLADMRDPVMGGRYDGRLRAHTPFQLVLSTPSACRSWASGLDGMAVIMLGVDGRDTVMAHEMGHSVGRLADEYSYGAEGRGCQSVHTNIAVGDDIPWRCLAENRSDARCPDGRPVDVHTVGTGCDTVGAPCIGCMMRNAFDDFCPVCYPQMEAAFADLLGPRLDESCNGADDDIDGVTDNGCACDDCTPACDSRECGPDGCFGECRACGAGEGCRDNVCVSGCESMCRTAVGTDVCHDEPGLVWCGAEAVTRCTCDTSMGMASWRDCGGCIPVDCVGCEAGEVCDRGSCTSGCPSGTSACDGTCVDLQSDHRNCGSCGTWCPDGQSCASGACNACPAGQVPCDGGCVDMLTNDAHCGWCGNTCGAWQRCVAGTCSSCPASGPLTDCAGVCVDLDTAAEHCGACGNACAGGMTCTGGRCACGGTSTSCGGECVELDWDRRNCGSCGNACGARQDCRGGTCSDCAAGTVLCEWGTPGIAFCVDQQTDRGHCGACHNACPDGQSCMAGRCTP